nr:hypothetical protein [Clostridia bacterium]
SYTIIRGDNSTEEERQAAVKLRSELRDKYGIILEIETDWVQRGVDPETVRHQNEILIGYTNRTESQVLYENFNVDTPELIDHKLMSNENHYVIAASEGQLEGAVDAFLAYLELDPDMFSLVPFELDVVTPHVFPMDDIKISGVSVFDYDAILCRDDYTRTMLEDIEAFSDLIYNACGKRLEVISNADPAAESGRNIVIGGRSQDAVKNAGRFSYGVIPTENSLCIEGRDIFSDALALDEFSAVIAAGMDAKSDVLFDEAILTLKENPKSDFLVTGSVGYFTATQQIIAEMKECGLDRITGGRPGDERKRHELCKWMTKSGLLARWVDDGLHLDNWDGEVDPYCYAEITWGHGLDDEPNASEFETLADLQRQYDELLPDKIGLVNIFPNYASEEQLGNPTYKEHVQQYLDILKPEYASVDIYPLNVNNAVIGGYFKNLDEFSTECRIREIPFAVYIQSAKFAASKRDVSEEDLRWQAYCCLAFGAEHIKYYTYNTQKWAVELGTYAIAGPNYEKTDRWYATQNVNKALHTLGDAFMEYRNLGAYGVNMENAPKYFNFENHYTGFDVLGDFSVTDDSTLLIGAFEKKEGEGHAFICHNVAEPSSNSAPIEVTVDVKDAKTVVLYQMENVTELTPKDGKVTFTLTCGEGIFAELK